MNKERVVLNDGWCRELVPGGLYFHVGYREPGVNLPEIWSLVYLGEDPTDGGDGEPPHALHVFQRADSYQEIGDWSELSKERREETSQDTLLAFDARNGGGILDLEGLIGQLQRLQKLISKGLGWECVLPEETA